MTTLHVRPAQPLQGAARVPGDKSISHRGLLLGACAQGETRLRGFLEGADCLATLRLIQALGVEVERRGGEVSVRGKGLEGWREPAAVLDCENSGTTLRLVAGLLAGRPWTSVLVGTPQLQGRPMGRITTPLRAMGARVVGRQDATLAPLTFSAAELQGREHLLPVASAQVKSCLLLAGLQAQGSSAVIEPGPCRDHTERLLSAMGAPLRVDGHRIEVDPLSGPLRPLDLEVPGDPSSAAFLLVAAACLPGSELLLRGVGVNPTRAGVLEVLARMGAGLTREGERESSGEPVAELLMRGQRLRACEVQGAEVATLIDELPVLAVAATQAEGVTIVRDAQELRVKETDRIEATAQELRKLGAKIEVRPDGWAIEGPVRLQGADVESQGDHRLAMALAVAGLLAEGETRVHGAEVCGDSFPGFATTLQALGCQIEERAC